jgi:hypothetical protein
LIVVNPCWAWLQSQPLQHLHHSKLIQLGLSVVAELVNQFNPHACNHKSIHVFGKNILRAQAITAAEAKVTQKVRGSCDQPAAMPG